MLWGVAQNTPNIIPTLPTIDIGNQRWWKIGELLYSVGEVCSLWWKVKYQENANSKVQSVEANYHKDGTRL